ncbi:hypothetical protein QVD17_01887 [Tagetes erecta]|uniref:Uncharacterized protein n=1 Tax=Tagetes erecta TaxID=13708 RepID=A0AAD8P8J2_TARER|nr:hypothetical protein QVD17_01887 [Tagetes erecta]
MATIQFFSPTVIHSPTKTSFSIPVVRSLTSSRSGSIAIKCCNASKNGGNATANKNNNNNNINGLEDLLSAYFVEFPNKDGPEGFVDSLRKAAQRVVQPEAETNKIKIKQVITELITRDEKRVVQHETEIKKLKQELNQYKTRSEEKLAQQETEIKEMKQERLSRHKTRTAEIEECQKRLSEALTLVEEAEISLQDIMQFLRADCSASVNI